MSENITLIYNDFRSCFENTPDFVINFYQKNAVFFNNIKSFREKEELRLFIEMTCKYVEAIYLKDHYNQAIDLVIHYQSLVDSEIERLNAGELKHGWYHSFQFVKGMAHYRLHDYKTSTPIFKRLIEADPENDLFRKWLKYSQNAGRLKIINVLSILFVTLGIIEIFFKSYIPNFYLKQFLLGFSFIGLVGSLLYESYLSKSLRKNN